MIWLGPDGLGCKVKIVNMSTDCTGEPNEDGHEASACQETANRETRMGAHGHCGRCFRDIKYLDPPEASIFADCCKFDN